MYPDRDGGPGPCFLTIGLGAFAVQNQIINNLEKK